MKNLLLAFWQLPQNLLGYLMSRLWKKRLVILPQRELEHLHGLESMTGLKIYASDYYSHKADPLLRHFSSVSLGKYICLTSTHDLKMLRHEAAGHTAQSKMLGWLYLPTVGVYSAVFCNLWDKMFHKHWPQEKRSRWYYSQPTEAWADRLGGVVREW